MSNSSLVVLLCGGLLATACAMTPDRPEIRDTRTIESIQKIVQYNRDDIYSIYLKLLDKKPKLSGRVVLRLVISPDGRVVQSEIVQSTMGDDQFAIAVQDAVGKLDFGPVRETTNMSLNYSLDFFPPSLPMPTNPRAQRW